MDKNAERAEKATMNAWRKTFEGYFNNRYSSIKSRCVTPGSRYYGFEVMPKDQWDQFLKETESERQWLFDNWKANGCVLRMAPSIDRIDPTKGYVPGNCRWITHSLNVTLSHRNLNSCRRGHAWNNENVARKGNGHYCRTCDLRNKRRTKKIENQNRPYCLCKEPIKGIILFGRRMRTNCQRCRLLLKPKVRQWRINRARKMESNLGMLRTGTSCRGDCVAEA